MFDNINGAKLASKRIKTLFHVTASQANELTARAAGYRDWHHLTMTVGTVSAPKPSENDPNIGTAIRGFLEKHRIIGVSVDDIQRHVQPEDEASGEYAADMFAFDAQDAREAGDFATQEALIERALRADPLCCHALLMKASVIESVEERIPLLRKALEGASRNAQPDYNHFLDRLKEGIAWSKQRSADFDLDEEEDDDYGDQAEDVFSMDSEGFYDKWYELPMRDYIRANFSLGEALLRCGRPSEASIFLREVVSQTPSDRFSEIAWLCSASIAMNRIRDVEDIANAYADVDMPYSWPKIVLLICGWARGDETALARLKREYTTFSICLARHLKIAAPGEDITDDDRLCSYDELDEAMQPEWARALSHGIRLNGSFGPLLRI